MITLSHLSKRFGARAILNDTDYHFPVGERIALVGANGVGKTTLLNIICGIEEADGGEVLYPTTTTLGYLPQTPNPKPAASISLECQSGATHLAALKGQMDNTMQALETKHDPALVAKFEAAEAAFRLGGGYALAARADAILIGLGFREAILSAPPQQLSGGWRMRLELARIFLKEPDFLVLDEPTNHLDLPSLVWVERYLQNFKGTLLFVSHDRTLLNRLATVTLHLHAAQLQAYSGNFDAFLEAREQRLAQEAATLEQIRRRKEAIERFVSRFGAKATKARQAQSRLKMLGRLTDLENEIPQAANEETIAGLTLPDPPPSGRLVLEVKQGSIGYQDPLARNINFNLERGQKIAIIGANGIGKSTFLKSVAGKLPLLAGEVRFGHQVHSAFFAQDQLDVFDESKSVLANLMAAAPALTPAEARSLLGGFLFHSDDVFKLVSVLSGGEKSRLGLAAVLAQRANLLLLDEPTNHLDMASVEALVQALADYAGTIVFVSHDRVFIDALCTHVFAMIADGRSLLAIGNLADYESAAQRQGFPNVLDAAPIPTKEAVVSELTTAQQNRAEAKTKQRQQQQTKKALVKLEARQEQLTSAIRDLENEMASGQRSHLEMTGLHNKYRTLTAELAAVEEEWLQLSVDSP